MLGCACDYSAVTCPLVPLNSDSVVDLVERERNDSKSEEGMEIVLWGSVSSKK